MFDSAHLARVSSSLSLPATERPGQWRRARGTSLLGSCAVGEETLFAGVPAMSIHLHCRRCRCALSVPARQAGRPMTCPRCHSESIIATPSSIAPHARKTAPSAAVAPAAIGPPESAADWTEPPARPLTRRPLVAVAIVSVLLVAAAWTSIAVWAQWKQLANQNEARVDDSGSNPAEKAQAR